MNVIAISNALYNGTSLLKKKDFVYIYAKEDLTYESLCSIKPEFVFFPHWSYIIPSRIYQNFKCVIFHMTDLPFGRGGSPLQNLISRGIYKTKISAISCVRELDAGDVYLKKELDVAEGSAAEIYKRAGMIMSDMVDEIVLRRPDPVPQVGDVVEFRRRTPSQSDIGGLCDVRKVYDYIRMLDADGYPKAFLQVGNVRYEFSGARYENGKVFATVEIGGGCE